MTRKADDDTRAKVRRLVGEGVSLRAAAKAAGVSPTSAARMVASAPFSEGQQPPGNIPPNSWNADQPPPPSPRTEFRRGYHDHTFRSFSAPLAFEGWSIERIRNAIAQHDQGMFLESSSLALIVSRFGPVYAALSQAIAPALALPRHVLGGARGLARLLRDEVEAQLAPRGGLLPSIYFPPTIWGSCAHDLRVMGFAVLQHVEGDPDPDTGVRPIFTRRWPSWAVQYYRYRRTYVALTTEGPIDIISGDGKFTLLADTEEPHFDGAIRALGLEVLDGTLVKQARSSYVDRYGNPKWIGVMPPNTPTHGPEGDAFFEAMETIQGPDGFGVIPNGADYKTAEMSSAQNTVFKDALDNVWQYCAAILLGSDGTMTRGTGVYSAPIFAGVRRDLVDRMLKAMVRGVNMGHIAPWLSFNFAASIESASGWEEPVLDIPLPDPDADARMDSYAKRVDSLHKLIRSERDAGCVVDQTRVATLAEQLGVEVPMLAEQTPAGATIEEWHVVQKVVSVDEARAALGKPPLPAAGGVDQLAEDHEQGRDRTGTAGKAADATGWASSDGSQGEAAAEPQAPAPAASIVQPSAAERRSALIAEIAAQRGAGLDVTQSWIDERARQLDVTPTPTLAPDSKPFAERNAAFLDDLHEYRDMGLGLSDEQLIALAANHRVPVPQRAEWMNRNAKPHLQ